METFEIIWGIFLILLGLGLAGAIVYLCLGAIGLIFLIPYAIASTIVGFVIAAIGVSYAMAKEFSFWAFFSIARLIGFKQRENKEEGQFREDRVENCSKPFDPYSVLEVNPGADYQQIKAAYLKQMAQYHPDKVTHLGRELQVFAEEKAKMIQQAYSQLHRA
jgi:hypothetical protein